MQTVTINDVGAEGDGWGLHEGQKHYVPYTLPGDVIGVPTKPINNVTDINFIQKSTTHIEPKCLHFGTCGGCRLQHMSASFYKDFKHRNVMEALKAHGIDNVPVEEPIILGAHQRRRINLKAQVHNKSWQLGYYRRMSHDIVDIIQCPLVVKEIEQLLEPLKHFLNMLNFCEKKLEISLTATESGLDIHFTTEKSCSLSLIQKEQMVSFAAIHRCARIGMNGETLAIFKTPYVVFESIKVEADAHGFLQASKAADTLMAQLLLESLPQDLVKSADLFCGRGTLTFPLLTRGPVDAFEMDQSALTALKKAAPSSYHHKLKAHERNLFRSPLSAYELSTYTSVVLNPPRIGALAQCKQLAMSSVPQIIYVSCNPQTFARDVAILQQQNYTFKKVIPIDQFHWSHHIEIFTVLEKK